MSREIKFRGKSIETGECIIGSYTHCHDEKGNPCIIPLGDNRFFPVAKETVGQLTGLKDKNGKEIYEGDIVIGDAGIECAVDWDKENARFHANGIRVKQVGIPAEAFVRREIIGNLHSNPELLGGENNG
jgi:hypothetical protein